MFAGAAVVLLLASCGGGGSSTKPTTTTATPTSTCSSTVSAPVGAPNIVTVAGASVGGVDIAVGNPQACPAGNAEVLGVADLSATRLTATNTGAQIHRGDTKIVILFGKGLSGSMQVSVNGQPGDFTITNQTGITATDGTPGVQFNVFVSPTAALGARSVVLRAANSDITTFTGGLEVIP
jgi:hypothetical protein